MAWDGDDDRVENGDVRMSGTGGRERGGIGADGRGRRTDGQTDTERFSILCLACISVTLPIVIQKSDDIFLMAEEAGN